MFNHCNILLFSVMCNTLNQYDLQLRACVDLYVANMPRQFYDANSTLVVTIIVTNHTLAYKNNNNSSNYH